MTEIMGASGEVAACTPVPQVGGGDAGAGLGAGEYGGAGDDPPVRLSEAECGGGVVPRWGTTIT